MGAHTGTGCRGSPHLHCSWRSGTLTQPREVVGSSRASRGPAAPWPDRAVFPDRHVSGGCRRSSCGAVAAAQVSSGLGTQLVGPKAKERVGLCSKSLLTVRMGTAEHATPCGAFHARGRAAHSEPLPSSSLSHWPGFQVKKPKPGEVLGPPLLASALGLGASLGLQSRPSCPAVRWWGVLGHRAGSGHLPPHPRDTCPPALPHLLPFICRPCLLGFPCQAHYCRTRSYLLLGTFLVPGSPGIWDTTGRKVDVVPAPRGSSL